MYNLISFADLSTQERTTIMTVSSSATLHGSLSDPIFLAFPTFLWVYVSLHFLEFPIDIVIQCAFFKKTAFFSVSIINLVFISVVEIFYAFYHWKVTQSFLGTIVYLYWWMPIIFFFSSGAITNKAAMKIQKSCSSSYMSACFHFFQAILLGMQWLGNIAG